MMMMMMMHIRRHWTPLCLLLLLLVTYVRAGFDFGDGCDGGSGRFTLSLPTAGQKTLVGEIPSGKWNVQVRLTAQNDVDVQLYDLENTTRYPEGEAIVAWCDRSADGACNLGVLGSDASEGTTTYANMSVGYSGYEGVEGQPGKEWIKVTGVTTRRVAMYAFAFQSGDAVVEYVFDRVQTACCLGTAACGGSFRASIARNAVVDIGEIPIGKRDLRVELKSPADVDIQLFDLDDATCASQGGRAIVAYSQNGADGSCEKGALGNNDGTPETTTYQDRTYAYSGYYGGQTSETYGNEYLSVEGNTNRRLMMKAFGYAAGEAEVSYTYYEDPNFSNDAGLPSTPSIDWMLAANAEKHRTDRFGATSALIVRRADTFEFVVSSGSQNSVRDVFLANMTGVVADNPNVDDGAETVQIYPASMIECEGVDEGNTRRRMTCALAADAPLGSYTLNLEIRLANAQGNASFAGVVSTTVEVLANPYKSKDVVYTSKTNRAEYVENEEGLVWQGLSDNNDGYLWSYDQYNTENLRIALRALRRLPVEDRGDMVLVSRHLTYSVGADICYGKWGSGSYTTGKPSGGYRCSKTKTTPKRYGRCREPDYWNGTTALFALHASVEMPVQYCQCFVYAAVLTSIGRSLGIPTRPVSTFQSAHDTERNRAIEKFYEVKDGGAVFDPITENIPSTDSVWSFHVWNEMYFDRPDLAATCSRGRTCANGWQAVDATPQELSAGGNPSVTEPAYQMGPASVRLIKQNLDPVCPDRETDATYGCYDGEFVISEVNANVNLWTRNGDDTNKGETSWTLFRGESYTVDPFGDAYNTIGLQISTKKKGQIPSDSACRSESDDHDCSAFLDDVTRHYKQDEPSGPGTPTNPNAGPDLTAGGRRQLSTTTTTTTRVALNVSQGLGVYPSHASVLVNEPHHPGSYMTLTLPFQNDGDDDLNVTCVFHAVAVDYRNAPFVNGSETQSSVDLHTTDTRTLAPGESGSCSRTVERESYRAFALTYLDTDLYVPEEAANGTYAPAYAVRVSVTVTVKNLTSGDMSIMEADHSKMICTPKIGLSTRSGAVRCENGRGSYVPAAGLDDVGGPLYHLTSGQRDCTDLNINSFLVNNGVCDADENVAGCWDGGDCCAFSCFYFNGGLVTTNADGELVPNHQCYALNDSETCLDPQLRGYSPPPEYASALLTPVAFGGNGSAEDFGESICVDLETRFEANATASCASDPCATACVEKVRELICEDETLARLEVDCLERMLLDADSTLASCNRPRCASRRTVQGCRCQSTWTYNGVSVFNASCANMELPGGEYHSNDWCNVVDGSCSTDDGNPQVIRPEYSATTMFDDGSFWDDCGTGIVSDVMTGALANVSTLNWTLSELSRVETQAYAWETVAVTEIDTSTGGDDDDGLSPGDDNESLSSAVIGLLVGAGVVTVVLGVVTGFFVLKCRVQRK